MGTRAENLPSGGLAASGSGGGPGAWLTGGGSSGDVTLAIADGGVTKGMLAASGGANGQVLGTDGSELVWKTGSGTLGLPYAGQASTGADTEVFRVTNTGGGRAIRGEAAADTAIWGVSVTGRAGVDGVNQDG